jgi:hypothetical protein
MDESECDNLVSEICTSTRFIDFVEVIYAVNMMVLCRELFYILGVLNNNSLILLSIQKIRLPVIMTKYDGCMRVDKSC